MPLGLLGSPGGGGGCGGGGVSAGPRSAARLHPEGACGRPARESGAEAADASLSFLLWLLSPTTAELSDLYFFFSFK